MNKLPLNQILCGDCVEVLKDFPENSIDLVVTDPPYGLSFMGKDWDKTLPPREAFDEIIRVLKPGALSFVMSSPRQDLLWRMLSMLEGVGFELTQSYIDWIYKCVTEDTEVLTIDGWELFCKSNQFMRKPILVYDIQLDQYRWEVPKLWSSYYIEDTVYRIKSNRTDQLVTRGHRVPIERSGRILYDFVENLSSPSKVLCLDDLSRVWTNLSGDEHYVATRNHLLFKPMQRDNQSETGPRLGAVARYPTHENLLEITQRARTQGTVTEKTDGRNKSRMEGRGNLLQNAWELRRGQVCPVSSTIQSDGSERRLYNGTQATRRPTVRSPSEAHRGSASLGSRSLEQQVIQSGSLYLQSNSQAIREEHGYSTTLATITREPYRGVVFCPTTSTGFWVARRKGKIFITGNTGFPKAYDVSKGIDRKNNRASEDNIKLGKYLKEQRISKGMTTINLGEYFKTDPSKINHGGCITNWEKGYNIPTPRQWKLLKKLLELDNSFDFVIERSEAEREKVGEDGRTWDKKKRIDRDRVFNVHFPEKERGIGFGNWDITIPHLVNAQKWDGWKSQTGLKPAHEPILMVNKPFSESTIVDNVLRWGTGAINVDSCRIPFSNDEPYDIDIKCRPNTRGVPAPELYGGYDAHLVDKNDSGRFPANLLVSDKALDTGKLSKSGTLEPHHKINSSKTRNIYGEYNDQPPEEHITYGDIGDQSRYFDLDAWAKHHGFLDVPKPDNSERDFGLKGRKRIPTSKLNLSDGKNPVRLDGAIPNPRRNIHPTVKPIQLMAYLIELGCPPDGVVLDPFVGSGTTCIAAKQLVRKFIGIEINPEYHALAKARVEAHPVPLSWFAGSETPDVLVPPISRSGDEK